MALRITSVRRKSLSMTSLIDVIFLLLLFFMLSSTFTRFAEIPLTGASAGRGGTTSDTPPLFLRLDENSVELNGQGYTLGSVIEQIDSLTPPEGQQLLIAPRDAVTSQRLVDLLVVLAARPDLSVVVLE
ncbi:outer membrane transport energization protein ExbD [Octadecabacter temperatus]|uniref:Biopolymer transport protein ExbD/TolR n=1 Tax=Octadecabacter temperatus TaxID=1458307 RepID=A0A0K0Y678_9RHOB|nr:biopolymer transporter ExbD [Octadecabacter temperatus]AKS46347.1 Biopolymer transport protein ExbD/TolR [Octadecabacter temperatus]SIO12312.1 outer membrane transport energization protein ExbD [Octadecabacter temperatus]